MHLYREQNIFNLITTYVPVRLRNGDIYASMVMMGKNKCILKQMLFRGKQKLSIKKAH